MTTDLPLAVLAAPVHKDAERTVGQHVAEARARGRCIGYGRYARTPGRIVWYLCRHDADPPSDRCGQCYVDDIEARQSEADDVAARAEQRRKLSAAIAPLRYTYDGEGWRKTTKAVIRDIEDAVRNAPGGTGNYWLALRLLAEVD